MTYEFELDSFQMDDKFYSLTVSVEYDVGNDGLGSYEYWGAKCFDAGHDYAEAESWGVEACLCLSDGTTEEVTDPAIIKRLEDAVESVVHSKMENVDITDDRDYEEDAPDPPDYD